MIDIQPQHLNFGKLLSGRLFRIPEYQRAYSWQHKQRHDLFSDIKSVAISNKDIGHFMATIVGLRRDKTTIITDEHQIIEVVDGQQRLTTLIILLNAIARHLDPSNAVEERVKRELEELLVKPDDVSLLLLQTNHDHSQYFSDYLRNGNKADPKNAKTVADRELLSAIVDCEHFVSSWMESGKTLAELVTLLKNKLTFIFHELSDEGTVYTVFEVLNSRGLDVSWFDRLKSMLMAVIFESESGNQKEIITEVHGLWAQIYRTIGLRIGLSTEALRFAATLKERHAPSRPVSETYAVELLRGLAGNAPAKVLEITKWLKSVTEAVDKLATDQRRNAVTKISQARLVAAAIYLRDDISASELDLTLRCWENVTFRIYGLFCKDARTRVGEYIRLAWAIFNERLEPENIRIRLREIGADFPIDNAVNELSDTDCYTGRQEELRYLLFRYEEHLAKEAGQEFNNEQWNKIWLESASDSIEHILAQSLNNEKLVHRIGNLLILPPKLNSKLYNKRPNDKIDAYTNTGLLVAKEVVPALPLWNEAAIVTREERLIDWARNEWAD
ncbi:MAG: DUF262 domain-containing HNH endonuclease family protein [Methylococcus sp.]|nr:DUF262 domain-containing HNH endonuclease family protein [Methylococcus sp.]